MIKKLFVGLIIASFTGAVALAQDDEDEKVPARPKTVHLYSPQAKVDITTSKIARLYGTVNAASLMRFNADMAATAHLKGDRVILIDSPGGEVSTGQLMLDAMKKEQDAGTKFICYVKKDAHSMAFNFLTRCDVRLMAPEAMSLVHKIARSVLPQRITAKVLRILADELDKDDEPFRVANAAAMHLTLQQYDLYCELETYWRAETLLNMGYLHGYGILKK